MPPSRLLIAAGEAVSDLESLPPAIRQLLDSADEILVMAPALPTRFQWLASDTDKTRELADERLRAVLSQVREAAPASGVVGADDPVLAFEETVEEFRPDHILVALRPADRTGWQERGLLDKLLERFDVPLTVFQVPTEA